MELSRPPRQEGADGRTILFAGLSVEVSEQDIREFLASCEGVEDVRLVENSEGSRGLAFVQFGTLEQYLKAWESLLERQLVLKDKGFIMREW